MSAALSAIRELYRLQSPCRLCPRRCGARRRDGQAGMCRASDELRIASVTLHHGEEPPISGTRGSGTIFFSHCTLHCLFCQNWPISRRGVGEVYRVDQLAEAMLRLQRRGAHNVNLVNPTHYWPQIAAAAYLARRRGLTIPLLANSNGFERVEVLALLTATVQIWLPDIKYLSPDMAHDLSGYRWLPAANWQAIDWLVDHYGPLHLDEKGLADAGMLIRHLVLPGRLEESRRVLYKLKRRYKNAIPISLMTQYFPAYQAVSREGLNRSLHRRERERAWRTARRLGLTRGWRQVDG